MNNWKKLPLIILVSVVALTVAFSQSTAGGKEKVLVDSPPQKEKKIRNLDEALWDMEKSEVELNKALKEIDRMKIEDEIREAMRQIDFSKIEKEMALAMKEADSKKISEEIQRELQVVNMERIRKEVDEALSKIDMDKIKMQIKESMNEAELKKLKKEMKALKPEMERSVKEAKGNIEKAKAELRRHKEFINALHQDGQLDKNKNYTVEYKNETLTVNGKTIPAETSRKYLLLLQNPKEFMLKKEVDKRKTRD